MNSNSIFLVAVLLASNQLSAFDIQVEVIREDKPNTPIPIAALFNSFVSRDLQKDGSLPPRDHPIVIVWNDGRILWSTNVKEGGAPYLEAQLDKSKIDDFLGELVKNGVFSTPIKNNRHYGQDSAYSALFIMDKERQIGLSSWHKYAEMNDKIVATASGLEVLEGRNRERVMTEQPEEDREFRRRWTLIEGALINLIPKEGKNVDAFNVKVEYAKISVKEDSKDSAAK